MHAIGAPELAANPDYATNPQRIGLRETITPEIAAVTSTLKRDEMLARFEKAKVPAGPINTIADLFHDPQAIARGIKVELPHPVAEGGSIASVRGPILMDGQPMVAERASPELDGDRQSVLSDAAWGACVSPSSAIK
jgi:crotonobetainyl-CoA:carnitine CoA-transferase CaiB-like acyl-CoA transferase